MSRVLAIDLGGTKTALALYEVTDEEVRLVRTRTVPSAPSNSLHQRTVSWVCALTGMAAV